MKPAMTRSFSWRDGERRIIFGRGTAAEAVALLGGPGYLLLTTERARAALPAVAAAAGAVHHLPRGTSRSWPPGRSTERAERAATAASSRSAAAA